MQKFEVKEIDLDLELKLRSGETEIVKPKQDFNGKAGITIADTMTKLERVLIKDQEKAAIEIARIQDLPEDDSEDAMSVEEKEKAIKAIEKVSLIGPEIWAKELELVYPKKAIWFIENIDPATIKQIVVYVGTELGGNSKK